MSGPGEIVHEYLLEEQLLSQQESASICLFASPKHQCSKRTAVEIGAPYEVTVTQKKTLQLHQALIKKRIVKAYDMIVVK